MTGSTRLKRRQCLAQNQVPGPGGEHGRQEGEAGQRRQVALGRIVEEDAVAGRAAQHADVEKVGDVKACRCSTRCGCAQGLGRRAQDM